MQDTQTVTSQRDTVEYLGPAEVLSNDAAGVFVRTDAGQRVSVELAFTFPYSPAVGDTLLVVAKPEGSYAIGVLGGSAQAALVFPADAEIRAGGTLDLTAEKGVTVSAPRLVLRSDSMRVFAGSLSEKADTAYRWIRDSLTVRAGESRRLIDGEDFSRSKRSVTLAEGQVKIDGNSVHLG